MDSILGIGTPELLIILLVAGIFLGPERIRPAARWLGRMSAQARALAHGVMLQLNRELDAVDETGEVKATLKEVENLRRQVTELRQELVNGARQPLREGQKALQETHAVMASKSDGRPKEAEPQKAPPLPPPPPPKPAAE